jgi:hypothetical protein
MMFALALGHQQKENTPRLRECSASTGFEESIIPAQRECGKGTAREFVETDLLV